MLQFLREDFVDLDQLLRKTEVKRQKAVNQSRR